MEGQSQAAIAGSRFRIERVGLQPAGGTAEPVAQRGALLKVPKAAQQPTNRPRFGLSRADGFQGAGDCDLVRLEFLEQETFKLAAMAGTRGVNAATTASQRATGLREPSAITGAGFSAVAFAPHLQKGEPQSSEE